MHEKGIDKAFKHTGSRYSPAIHKNSQAHAKIKPLHISTMREEESR